MSVKVSIIVPVYNVEKYLEKCLNSLVNQTLKEIEIIIVEDCSTDLSLEICEKYSEKYKNIKLIKHSHNKGLSEARNTGLKYVNGEYIGFVDSDDWISYNMYELLYEDAVKNNSDISMCGIVIFEEGKEKNINNFGKYTFLEREEFLINYLNRKISTNVWNKIYKKNLFSDNKINFPICKFAEDQYSSFLLIYNSNTISSIKECLYFYNIRGNSLTTSKFSEKNIDEIYQIENIKKYLIQKNEFNKYKKYYQIRYFDCVFRDIVCKSIYDLNIKEYCNVRDKIIYNFKENMKGYIFNSKLGIKKRIKVFLYINLYYIYYYMMRFMYKLKNK